MALLDLAFDDLKTYGPVYTTAPLPHIPLCAPARPQLPLHILETSRITQLFPMCCASSASLSGAEL